MQNVGSENIVPSSYEHDAPRVDAHESNASSAPSPRQELTSKGFFLYALIALGLALFIRLFIAAPYLVQGASMEPTFDSWHYLIIDRITYHLSEPARGDVIVFRFPQDTSRSFIKRVIGLPGETVTITGETVTIFNDAYPDGLVLDEPYIDPQYAGESNITMTLADDEYFVLGDNRKESADSRYWGSLPSEDIVGRVLIRLYPFSLIGLLPGVSRYQSPETQ